MNKGIKSGKIFNNSIIFNLAVFILVSTLNLIFVLNHEIWGDEAQAWLIARDFTPVSLFNITSLEGHPFLWYYILMPFAKLNFPCITLNLVSYFIMELTLFIVLFYSPLDNVLKFVVSFSPMFIYTYSVISRNYCLCALFTVLIALAYRSRNKKPVIYGILLALLLQTHIIMAGMTFIMCVVWLIETIKQRNDYEVNFKKNIFGMSIPFLSALFLLYEFRNVASADASKQAPAIPHKHFVFAGICIVYVFSLLVLYRIIENKSVYKLIVITSFSVLFQLLIYLFVYSYSLDRLMTWAFILLFFVWNSYFCKTDGLHYKKLRIAYAVLILCLAAVLFKNIYVKSVKDIVYPYTDAKNAAEFIDKSIDTDDTVIINSDESCIAVVPYLRNATLYDPFAQKELTYISRNKNRTNKRWLDYEEFMKTSKSCCGNKNYVYMLLSPTSTTGDPDKIISNSEVIYDSTKDYIITEEAFILVKYCFK
ncbi:MAG: hypothetical protein K6F76_02290 [Clostridiales bacterium]|nr:hypothetical protein [Clostridiales bacterium]